MPGRDSRDIIDDIMVQIDLLERDLAALSRTQRTKGRILNMFNRIERMRDLLIELRRATQAPPREELS